MTKKLNFPKKPGIEYPSYVSPAKAETLRQNWIAAYDDLKKSLAITYLVELFTTFGIDNSVYKPVKKKSGYNYPDLILMLDKKFYFMEVFLANEVGLALTQLKKASYIADLEANFYIYALFTPQGLFFYLKSDLQEQKSIDQIFNHLTKYLDETTYYLETSRGYLKSLNKEKNKINYDNQFIFRKIRGKLVETAFIELFNALGFDVYEAGQEAFLNPNLLGQLHNFKNKNSLSIRKSPDLIIKKDQTVIMVEVKHSSSGYWDYKAMGDYPNIKENIMVAFAGCNGLKCLSVQKMKRGNSISPRCDNYLYKAINEFAPYKDEIAFYSNQVLKELPYLIKND